MMKSTGGIAQLLLLLITFIIRPSLTKLITRPRNMAVVAGNDVIIRCSSDQVRWNASWTRFGEDGRVSLFREGQRMPEIDGRRFVMEATDSGRLDLSVREARVEDAGLYVCSDSEHHASAHLLVVTSPPTCSVIMSSSLLTDVVDGDRLNLHCRIEHADYIEYLTPHYDWTVLELDDNEQQRVHITSLAAENSGEVYVMASWPTVPQLHCSVYFNRSAGSSYSDVASNAPSYRGNCTTNTINVLSPPRDVRVNDTSTAENKSRQLLCSAAGRPTPSYEWYRVSGRGGRDEDQLMVSGELLVLTDIGRHEVRCVTINVIRGVMHKITSDTVIVDVLPPRHQNDTDMITDSEVHRNRNNDRITTGSVNEAIVYEGNAMSRPLINSPYFVAGMCSIAVVMLFITIPTTVAVVVRCRHRTDQKDGNVGTELETAASSTWTLPNTQGDSQNGEESEHGDERIVEDDRSSAVYDEIATTSSEFSQPPTAASEQYSKLISSDVAPVVASGTNVDVYSPLQRDVSNTLKKITIAIGKCDVSIVFNGDGETGTVPSI